MRSLRSKSARGRPCKSPKVQGFHQPNPHKPIFRSGALYHLWRIVSEKEKVDKSATLGKDSLKFHNYHHFPGKTKSAWDKISYFLLVSSCFTKTLWIISDLPSDHFWPFWCWHFGWPVPNVLQVLLVGFATDLASWACQQKVTKIYRSKQNSTGFLFEKWIFFGRSDIFGGETLKILGKILSIRLTDWKLSKRNRPKLEDAIFVNLPSFDTSLKKKTSEWRSKGVSIFPFPKSLFLVVGETAYLRLLAAGPTTRDQKGLYLSTRGLTSSKNTTHPQVATGKVGICHSHEGKNCVLTAFRWKVNLRTIDGWGSPRQPQWDRRPRGDPMHFMTLCMKSLNTLDSPTVDSLSASTNPVTCSPKRI